jgi:predicted nuclease of predicted toxin-antitoxin system
VKFYFDEDSGQRRLIAALRSHGIDVVTSHDAGMNARDDESHLKLAAEEGRILVSANARDFALLHRRWLEQGRSHFGVLIIPQQRYSTGEIVRRMVRLTSSRFGMASGLYYLSNF